MKRKLWAGILLLVLTVGTGCINTDEEESQGAVAGLPRQRGTGFMMEQELPQTERQQMREIVQQKRILEKDVIRVKAQFKKFYQKVQKMEEAYQTGEYIDMMKMDIDRQKQIVRAKIDAESDGEQRNMLKVKLRQLQVREFKLEENQQNHFREEAGHYTAKASKLYSEMRILQNKITRLTLKQNSLFKKDYKVESKDKLQLELNLKKARSKLNQLKKLDSKQRQDFCESQRMRLKGKLVIARSQNNQQKKQQIKNKIYAMQNCSNYIQQRIKHFKKYQAVFAKQLYQIQKAQRVPRQRQDEQSLESQDSRQRQRQSLLPQEQQPQREVKRAKLFDLPSDLLQPSNMDSATQIQRSYLQAYKQYYASRIRMHNQLKNQDNILTKTVNINDVTSMQTQRNILLNTKISFSAFQYNYKFPQAPRFVSQFINNLATQQRAHYRLYRKQYENVYSIPLVQMKLYFLYVVKGNFLYQNLKTKGSTLISRLQCLQIRQFLINYPLLVLDSNKFLREQLQDDYRRYCQTTKIGYPLEYYPRLTDIIIPKEKGNKRFFTKNGTDYYALKQGIFARKAQDIIDPFVKNVPLLKKAFDLKKSNNAPRLTIMPMHPAQLYLMDLLTPLKTSNKGIYLGQGAVQITKVTYCLTKLGWSVCTFQQIQQNAIQLINNYMYFQKNHRESRQQSTRRHPFK